MDLQHKHRNNGIRKTDLVVGEVTVSDNIEADTPYTILTIPKGSMLGKIFVTTTSLTPVVVAVKVGEGEELVINADNLAAGSNDNLVNSMTVGDVTVTLTVPELLTGSIMVGIEFTDFSRVTGDQTRPKLEA